MNPKICQSAFLALIAATTILSSCAAVAAIKVDVTDKPKSDDIMSPEPSGVKSKGGFKAKDWLEVEAKIKVEMAPEPKNKTCDKLTVKWYIAVENPDKAGTYLKLTKEIEYVNVPLKEDVFCSVYLSPASIRRWSPRASARRGWRWLTSRNGSKSAAPKCATLFQARRCSPAL